MNNKKTIVPGKLVCSILLFTAAVVWGISFVTQSVGGQLMGAYSFNASRMLLGALVIFLCTRTFSDRLGLSAKPAAGMKKKQLLVGLVCGIFLAVGTNMQQIALNAGTTTGKAGFITALYIIMVPIISLLFRQRAGWNIWLAVLIAVGGLYFLCINGSFRLSSADLLLMGCALGFSFQIIVIDRFGKGLDGLRLAGMQFIVCGIISALLAVIFEIVPSAGGIMEWLSVFKNGSFWISLLYMGMGSCGIGYTFQILGQQNLDPTIASLIMSLESVFSAISGWVFLGQTLSGRELIGCGLMFAAVILAQISFKKKSA